ncbi:hypothetical protein L1049_010586 [Liquidambar formosana]|uniref:Uncharacterized protein n=1 Tax=Liquidambar formosana TaxID=63359 RepID=A0AAP0NAI4_LIQFO
MCLRRLPVVAGESQLLSLMESSNPLETGLLRLRQKLVLFVANGLLLLQKIGEIKDEDKKVLYQCILDKFEIDLSRPNVKHTVDTMLKNRHKNWRHKLYKFYKEFPPQEASQHLPKYVKQNDWDHLCERFSNDKFQQWGVVLKIEESTHIFNIPQERSM